MCEDRQVPGRLARSHRLPDERATALVVLWEVPARQGGVSIDWASSSSAMRVFPGVSHHGRGCPWGWEPKRLIPMVA